MNVFCFLPTRGEEHTLPRLPTHRQALAVRQCFWWRMMHESTAMSCLRCWFPDGQSRRFSAYCSSVANIILNVLVFKRLALLRFRLVGVYSLCLLTIYLYCYACLWVIGVFMTFITHIWFCFYATDYWLFSRGCFQASSSSVIHCFFLIFVPLSPRRVSCYGGFAGLFLFPFRDLLFCLSYACVVCLFLFQVFFLALRLLVEVFVRHRHSSFLQGGSFLSRFGQTRRFGSFWAEGVMS